MAFLTASSKTALKKMNTSAAKAGLGDLLGVNVAAAGNFTTAGGDANEQISVPGALATDIVLLTVKTLGTGARTIVSAAAAADVINIVLSGDPTTNHVLSYALIRIV